MPLGGGLCGDSAMKRVPSGSGISLPTLELVNDKIKKIYGIQFKIRNLHCQLSCL